MRNTFYLNTLSTLLCIMITPSFAAAPIPTDKPSEKPTTNSIASDENSNEQLVANSVRGAEVAWLTVANDKKLAVFQAATTPIIRGLVLIIPDQHSNAQWQAFIIPLRQQLAKKGWSSLSIEMPTALMNSAKVSKISEPDKTEATKTTSAAADSPYDWESLRKQNDDTIKAAIQYIQAKEVKNILLLGHGSGGIWAGDFWQKYHEDNPDIKMLILVSAYLPEPSNPDLQKLQQTIVEMNAPLLDVYGSIDWPKAMIAAEHRKMWGERSDNKLYWQRLVSGADHFYHFDNINALVKTIEAYAQKNKTALHLNDAEKSKEKK